MQLIQLPRTKIDLLYFFGLAFLISWGIWIPLIVLENQSQIWFSVAGFGPTLSALALVIIRSGLRKLSTEFKLHFRVQLHWIFISIFGTPLVMLAALGLHMALGGAMPRYIDSNHILTSINQWPLAFVVYGYIFIFTALGEEFGWRGYVLPRLLKHYSPFISSLILGLIWAGWHLPLFWMAGNFHQQLPLSWFLLQILGSTFIYTWMSNYTNGSLWMALFFHTSSNAAVGLLPILPLDNYGSLRPLWLVVLLLWAAVGVLLWAEKKTFFLPTTGDQNTASGGKTIKDDQYEE